LTDQANRTDIPFFNTPFGLIIYFSEKEASEDSDKKDRFFNLLNLEKIPFYLIKSKDFSLTIFQILCSLEKTNQQTFHFEKNISNSCEFEYQKESGIDQNLQSKGCEQSPISKAYHNINRQDDNILFFSGFSRDQLENFLEKIRDDKYPRFPLKAVATKNNYNFSFDKLINELTQDRIVVSHVINLRKRINALTKHLADNNTLNSQQKILLKKEIDQAENLLKDGETNFDLELFRIQIQKFNYLLAKLKHEYQAEKPQLDNTD